MLCYGGAVKSEAVTLGVLLCSLACSPPGEEQSDVPVQASVQRESLHDADGRTVGVLAGSTLYLNGIGPVDTSLPVADQTTSAMERLGSVLSQKGLTYGNLVSCHVHLADMDSYSEMNAVYGSFFEPGRYPARTTVEMPGLPGAAGIFLLCVAYTDGAQISVVEPSPDAIPPAMGPYSPGVRADSTVYLSGQGGRDPQTRDLPESADGQVRQTLSTIGTILEAAGLGYSNVVHASSYMPRPADLEAVDAGFKATFDAGGAPSRSDVFLSRLPGDIAVEITVVAVDDNYVTRLFTHDTAPGAARSPASMSGDLVYTAPVLGMGETFQQQVADALDRQDTALSLGLMDLSNVVRVTAYLGDLQHMEALQQLLAEAFPENPPALATLQANLPSGTGVALEVIAVR